MTGVDQPDGDAVGNPLGLPVRQRNEQTCTDLNIGKTVDRQDRLLTGAKQPARVLFRVGLLQPGRVFEDELGEVDCRGRRVDRAYGSRGTAGVATARSGPGARVRPRSRPGPEASPARDPGFGHL